MHDPRMTIHAHQYTGSASKSAPANIQIRRLQLLASVRHCQMCNKSDRLENECFVEARIDTSKSITVVSEYAALLYMQETPNLLASLRFKDDHAKDFLQMNSKSNSKYYGAWYSLAIELRSYSDPNTEERVIIGNAGTKSLIVFVPDDIQNDRFTYAERVNTRTKNRNIAKSKKTKLNKNNFQRCDICVGMDVLSRCNLTCAAGLEAPDRVSQFVKNTTLEF